MNVKCESCLTACLPLAPTFPTHSPSPTTKLPPWCVAVFPYEEKSFHLSLSLSLSKITIFDRVFICTVWSQCYLCSPSPPFVFFPHLTFAQFHICKQAFAYGAFCQLSARTENSWHVCHEPRLSEALKRARRRQKGEKEGEREGKQCLLLEIDSMWKICSASATCKLLLRALPLAISSLQMKLPQLSRTQSQIP